MIFVNEPVTEQTNRKDILQNYSIPFYAERNHHKTTLSPSISIIRDESLAAVKTG